MTQLAIIGGTGLSAMPELKVTDRKTLDTPYGQPSDAFVFGQINGLELVFLARHGNPHCIPPHKINYRANIWALKELGVNQIIAVAAVGGITEKMRPAHIVFPSQLIDYSYGREHTFFDHNLDHVVHIDFSCPYSQNMQNLLFNIAQKADIEYSVEAVYGCTQGPRLETPAEIERMRRDGCDLVGMTGMPEASLAREMEIDYATCAVIANWAAGVTDMAITMDEIMLNLQHGMKKVERMLQQLTVTVN